MCSAGTNTQFGNKAACAANQYLSGYSAGSYNATGAGGTCTVCSSPSAGQYVTAVCNATTDTSIATRAACAANQSLTGFSGGSYNSLGSAGVCCGNAGTPCRHIPNDVCAQYWITPSRDGNNNKISGAAAINPGMCSACCSGAGDGIDFQGRDPVGNYCTYQHCN